MGARAATWCGRVLGAAVVVSYPLLVYHGLLSWSARQVALVLLLVLAPLFLWRAWRARRLDRKAARGLLPIPLVVLASLAAGAALDAAGFVLVVPVAINALLLGSFASTLRGDGVPMIERFARLQVEELSAEEREWCRLWTWIWCGFFVVNGSIAAGLAAWAPVSWWAFHTGLLSYAVMGVLFAVEWLIRRRRFPRPDAPVAR